jgi:two-component system, chemotaxis family, protein-glutamate methylesterase/glutaminase
LKRIRVLVVDDSSFIRKALPRLLESDPDIEVVGTASDGAEGLALVKALRPDVVTLDVQMPVMDGLTALQRIMDEAPTRVVMVSSTTAEGTHETVRALTLGAVDFMQKPVHAALPTGELAARIKSAYAGKIRTAASIDVTRDKFRALREQLAVGRPASVPPPPPPRPADVGRPASGAKVVAIAASTGGPAALQVLLARLPADLPAGVVVVQHIAAAFSRPLAEILDTASPLRVREARDGDLILPGEVLICPGDQHLTIEGRGQRRVRLSLEPASALYRPSADVLFESVAAQCAPETCAVILTGMGDDGARGMLAARQAGALTIAQDEATSLIFGMGQRAIEAGGVRYVLPLGLIAPEIVRACTPMPVRPESTTREN